MRSDHIPERNAGPWATAMSNWPGKRPETETVDVVRTNFGIALDLMSIPRQGSWR